MKRFHARGCVIAVAAVALTAAVLYPMRASAQGFEVGAHVLGSDGFGGTLGGLSWKPGLRAGVRLTDRFAVLSGIDGGMGEATLPVGFGGTVERGSYLSVPLEAELLLDTPRAGRVVPALRFGASYTRIAVPTSDWYARRVDVRALAGVDYDLTRVFALTLDGGLDLGRGWASDNGLTPTHEWSLDVIWSLGFVLRP